MRGAIRAIWDSSLLIGENVNNQTNQIDNFISSGVNLILLGAADSKGIAPAVMPAKQAGVKDPNSFIAATAAQDPYVMAQKPKEEPTLIAVGLIAWENVHRYAGWSNGRRGAPKVEYEHEEEHEDEFQFVSRPALSS